MSLLTLPNATLAYILSLIDLKSRLNVRRVCRDLRIIAAAAIEGLHPTAEGYLDPNAWTIFYHAAHLWLSGLRKELPKSIPSSAQAIRVAAKRLHRLTIDSNRLSQHDTIALLQAAMDACSESLTHLHCSGNSISTTAADNVLENLPSLQRLSMVLHTIRDHQYLAPSPWHPTLTSHLTHLDLTGWASQALAVSAAALRSAPHLQHLALANALVSEPRSLGSLPQLRSLSLRCCGHGAPYLPEDGDADVLVYHSMLVKHRELQVDVPALARCHQLTALQLQQVGVVGLSAGLALLTGLRQLSLLQCSQEHCVQLARGQAYRDLQAVVDLASLSRSSGLQRLHLASVSLLGLHSLAQLPALKELQLEECDVPRGATVDVRALGAGLRSFCARSSSEQGRIAVHFAELCSSAEGLQVLQLQGVLLSNTAAISRLVSLKQLHVERCQVANHQQQQQQQQQEELLGTSLQCLAALTKLRSLKLPDLVLEQEAAWQVLASLPLLRELHLAALGTAHCYAGSSSSSSSSHGSSSIVERLSSSFGRVSASSSSSSSKGGADLGQSVWQWQPSQSVRQLFLTSLPGANSSSSSSSRRIGKKRAEAYAGWLAGLLPGLECVQCRQVPGLWQLVHAAIKQQQQQEEEEGGS